jgi:ATP-binding cassette, subfamily F, member 3
MEAPLEGEAALGEHNVIPAYFEQNQAEALDLSKEVLAMVFEVVPDWSQSQVRSYLGRFGFSNDDVFKEAGMLSGGEKARLALALLLLRPSNLLLLDEPTNHLDIPAKRMLEEAVIGYEGAAMLVSHDRAFVSKVANRIVELRDGELVLYRGDYAYYMEKKREEAEERERLRQEKERQAKREANRQRQRIRARAGRERSETAEPT